MKERITVDIETEIKKATKIFAIQHDMTMTEVIEKALPFYMDRADKPVQNKEEEFKPEIV